MRHLSLFQISVEHQHTQTHLLLTPAVRYLGFVQVYSLVVALLFMNRFFSSLASTFSLSPSHICGWSHEHRCLVKELVLYGSASKFLLWKVSERASPGKQVLGNGSQSPGARNPFRALRQLGTKRCPMSISWHSWDEQYIFGNLHLTHTLTLIYSASSYWLFQIHLVSTMRATCACPALFSLATGWQKVLLSPLQAHLKQKEKACTKMWYYLKCLVPGDLCSKFKFLLSFSRQQKAFRFSLGENIC